MTPEEATAELRRWMDGHIGEPLTSEEIRRLQSEAMNWMREMIQQGLFEVQPLRVGIDKKDGTKILVRLGQVTVEEFEEVVGHLPERDDLDRANCNVAGAVGHYLCGWCGDCDLPRFICGHGKGMKA